MYQKHKMFIVLRKNHVILLFILASFVNVFSQNKTDSVQYSIDFKFNDGLFITFDQVLANQAVPYKNIITSENYLDAFFITKVVAKKKIKFFFKGQKTEIETKNIWGYATNGVLYIQHMSKFYRIPSIGKISFFIATEEVKYQTQIDPWNMNYYDPYNTTTRTSTELHKYLIDFENGTLYDYSIQNIATLIQSDSTLFEEFTALKKRKRKQMAFIYLRRFNDKNSLYFPTY